MGAKGTPREAIERMSAELAKAYATPEIKTAWTSLGSEIPTQFGKDFGDFVDAEIKRWAEVTRASGAKLD